MGTVIEFDHRENGRGFRIEENKIDMLLSNLPAMEGIPQRIGAVQDVGEPRLERDMEVAKEGTT